MLHDLSDDKAGDSGAGAPVADERLARQGAIRQIERRRRFWFRAGRADQPRGRRAARTRRR